MPGIFEPARLTPYHLIIAEGRSTRLPLQRRILSLSQARQIFL